MAFKLRLEFPGAIYHAVNRGNDRRWMFADARTKTAFEACLFEACKRCQWLLHAFVVMSNHHHLVIETPQGNLVAGMQWLQSTFANRFNRLRKERGHLFQSRYKALLVEAGDALGQICHYVHPNPVRAGILPVTNLPEHRWSSAWYLARPAKRPQFLRVEAALTATGGLPDSRAGWNCYADYLRWQAAEGPAGKNSACVAMSRGWAIGSEEFKQALLRDPALATEVRAWPEGGAAEVRSMRWETALAAAHSHLPPELPRVGHKSAPWKVAVASHMKETTDAPNQWLAIHLDMGSAAYVSKHIGLSRQSCDSAVNQYLEHLAEVKGKACTFRTAPVCSGSKG